jgi:hypothetical protein
MRARPHLSCSICLRQGRVLQKVKKETRKSVSAGILPENPTTTCHGEHERAYQRAQSSAVSELAMKGLSICLMAWSPQRILRGNIVREIYY